MRARFITTVFIMAASCGICLAQSRKPNEKQLWEIWEVHESTEDNIDGHIKVIKAALQFKKDNKFDPLGTVSQSLAAWHLLKAGRTDAALQLFTPISKSKTTDLQKAGSFMAQTWLTRLDMKKMTVYLESYYKKNINYPATLDPFKSLPEDKRPPFVDRWGKPWEYKLVPYISFPKIVDQRYSITTTSPMPIPKYEDAIALPYGNGLNIRPIQVKSLSRTQGTTVLFETIPEPARPAANDATAKPAKRALRFSLSTGSNPNGMYLAYAGDKVIVITDGNHWKIMSKP